MAITVITTPDPLALVKNPIGFTISTDSSDPSVKLRCRVYVETAPYADTYVFGFEQEQSPDVNGQATFYLQRQLQELLAYNLPDLTNGGAHIAPTVCKRYKIFYGEKLTTSSIFIGEFYHEDLAGGAPDYLKWLDIGSTLDDTANYMVIAETVDEDLVVDIGLRIDAVIRTFGVREVHNNHMELRFTTLSAGDPFDEIRTPAFVKCTLYNTPVIYTEL